MIENQALVWLGAMYAPLLPVFGLIANVIAFYFKLLLAVWVHSPPITRYSASRTSNLAYGLMLCKPSLTPSLASHLSTPSLNFIARLPLSPPPAHPDLAHQNRAYCWHIFWSIIPCACMSKLTTPKSNYSQRVGSYASASDCLVALGIGCW